MKNWQLIYITAGVLTVLTGGCISATYKGESFPSTDYIVAYESMQNIPANYVIIGRGKVSGEYSGTTNAELRRKLTRMGMQNGADAMVIIGTRIIPDGQVADSSSDDFITATDAPDQAATEIEFNNILNVPAAENSRFIRIMYADFLRRKVPEKSTK